MNNRIYPGYVMEKEMAKLQGKIYCPNCYSIETIGAVSYFPYIESDERGTTSCMNCRKRYKHLELLNKEQVRNKKIDEVLRK